MGELLHTTEGVGNAADFDLCGLTHDLPGVGGAGVGRRSVNALIHKISPSGGIKGGGVSPAHPSAFTGVLSESGVPPI